MLRRPRAPRRFLRDDRGVTDLPLKLLITAVVLAITVPAGFKELQQYSRDAAEREAAASMAELESAGRQVVVAGVGTSLTITLDFAGGTVSAIEYARAGANLAEDFAEGPVLAFKVAGRPERVRVAEPNVFFQHVSGEPAGFTRGTFDVRLTHAVGDFGSRSDVHYVEIRFE